MKTNVKLKYRQCCYCNRIVPSSYNFVEHIRMCKQQSKYIKWLDGDRR